MKFNVAVLLMLIAALVGCSSKAHRGKVQALFSKDPIQIDGRLDEPIWKSVPKYSLAIHVDPVGAQEVDKIQEPAIVQFAYDKSYFYAAFTCVDGDVVQENQKDQQHHYTSGDVAEILLKPLDGACFWEFHVTPGGQKTAIHFPSRGRRGLDSNFNYRSRATVAATVEGTINDYADKDHGWTAEIAIPLDELSLRGVPFDSNHQWTLLAGRYNYGCGLENVEISSYPRAVRVNFHRHEIYSLISFSPAR